MASDLTGAARLHVVGDVHQPAAAARSVSSPLNIDGDDLRLPVSVPEPCPCGIEQGPDVRAFVAAAMSDNDNVSAGFVADSLASVLATDFVTVRAVGRMFASSINVAGNLTLVVEEKSMLFVAGDMSVAGPLHFEIGPRGSLDLFVAGDLTLGGTQTIASSARPAQLRVYVARDKQVTLGVPAGFWGHLYAPGADVTLTGTADVYGSVFARADIVSARRDPLRQRHRLRRK